MIVEDKEKNLFIQAKTIKIGKEVSFGNNIDIRVKEEFTIGNRSRLGNDVEIRGRNVKFGSDLYHSSGLVVGGGGIYHPNANLTIGDRCTIHNNFINVCEEIKIGDDVGLSPESAILSHGYWLSVLEGFPATFAGVTIGNGVIIGYRTLIMMGVTIGENAVIGANSVITKNLEANAIHAGSPARIIRKIKPLEKNNRVKKVKEILDEYKKIAEYHGINPEIKLAYPKITVNNCVFDVETFEYEGEEDRETDDFRDYIRKWGIRLYTKRPFRSAWNWE